VLTDGKGADVIYDPVGGDYSEAALRSIAWRGRHLVVGFANGEIPRIPLNPGAAQGMQQSSVSIGAGSPRASRRSRRRACSSFLRGSPRASSSRRFRVRYALADAPSALRAMLDRKVTGKIVVLPEA